MSSFLEFVNDDVGLSDEFLLSPFNSASDCPDFFPPPSYETTFAQTNRGTTKLNLAQFASIDTDWHSLFSVTPISTICSSGATVSSVKPATKPDTSALKAPRRRILPRGPHGKRSGRGGSFLCNPCRKAKRGNAAPCVRNPNFPGVPCDPCKKRGFSAQQCGLRTKGPNGAQETFDMTEISPVDADIMTSTASPMPQHNSYPGQAATQFGPIEYSDKDLDEFSLLERRSPNYGLDQDYPPKPREAQEARDCTRNPLINQSFSTLGPYDSTHIPGPRPRQCGEQNGRFLDAQKWDGISPDPKDESDSESIDLVQLNGPWWAECNALSQDDQISSEFTIKYPFKIAEGLCPALLACSTWLLKELDDLEDSGFAIGMDILPRDVPLCDFEDEVYFTDSQEMLWVEYKSTCTIDAQNIREIATRIAERIKPYAVAIFDRSEFGVGVIVSKATRVDSAMSDSDFRGPMPSYDNSASTLRRSSIHHFGKATSNHGGGVAVTQIGSDSGRTGDQANATGYTYETYGRADSQTENDSNADHRQKNDDGPVPDTSGPNRRPTFNNAFTGSAKICLENNLYLKLTLSFGLNIFSATGANFADCEISLDPVIVSASRLSPINGGNSPNRMAKVGQSEHLYVTERVEIIVGTSGDCEPPRNIHPLPQHFAHRRGTSKIQAQTGFQGFWYPNLREEDYRGKEDTMQYDAVTLGLEVLSIATVGENEHEWIYKLKAACGTNIEFSTENPPRHKATYRVLETDNLEYLKVVVQAVFRNHGRLLRQKSHEKNDALKILGNLEAMHIVATLEVKLRRDGNNWFLFPSEYNQGRRLGATLKFQKGFLRNENTDNKIVHLERLQGS